LGSRAGGCFEEAISLLEISQREMLKSIIFAILMGFAVFSYAQIAIGRIEGVKFRAGKFDDGDLAALKATETIFICLNEDDPVLLENEIKKVWKFTPIKVVKYADAKSIDLAGKSVFSLGALVKTSQAVNSTGATYGPTSRDIHCYLNLWMPVKNKKGKKSKLSFCRLEMFVPLYFEKILGYKIYTDESLTEEAEIDRIGVVYEYASIYNWNPGFLVNYFRMVNDYLEKGELHWLFASGNDEELAELKKHKLYVPDYVLTHHKRKGIMGMETTERDPVAMFSDYPYQYEVMKAKEIGDKILAGEEMFYYMVWVRSYTDTYLNIFNGKTGKLVFWNYDPMEKNLEASKIKKLAKAIKKAGS
jgi:hypothetical protein